MQPQALGRIVIAGGTGYLGLNLARYLGRFDCEFPDVASALRNLYASEPHDGRRTNRHI